MSVAGAKLIGSPVARREDDRILRGQGRFLDDIERPGQLHAAFVRSPFARARIGGIAAPPGVRLFTADTLAGRVRRFPAMEPPGAEVDQDAGHPVLAEGEVRYVGQPVAMVVAESRAEAEDAVELVEVDYDPLDAVVDPRTAPEALMRWHKTAGDVDGAFAAAAHVVRSHGALPRLVAVPMETRGVIAEHDGDQLTLWISAQDPHRPRANLAHVLDRPDDSIRIVVPDVGGAFGSKGSAPVEAAVLAVAAADLGRPVKWAEDRMENFLASYQGRGMEGEVELALDADGTMLAVRARLWADLGAFLLPATAVPPHTAAMLMCGAYRVPAAEVEVVGARTDKVPTGPYRGAGRPEAAFFLERAVDDAARALGMDPVELRRRNLIREWPYETPLGWTYDSGDYERCLDLALDLLPDAPPADERFAVGTGVGMYVERAGGQWESADVTLRPDGRLIVRSGSSPHGQGHDTTFAQIAADHLGIPLDDVELVFGDSAAVPAGVGTFASRSVAMGGSAIVEAIDALVAQATDEPVLAVAARNGGLHASARFESPLVFGSGAYAARVRIDRATGELVVLALAAVDDAGRIVNPLLAHGQVTGGIAQGLGEVLSEAAEHDELGQLTNASLADYSLLTAAEMPPLAIGVVESPSPLNPLGAKGVGEGGAIGTLPAVANAVADALDGVSVDPPYGEEKLWRALRGGA
jgi:carbon-monoxide dehydrogenase large subunit